MTGGIMKYNKIKNIDKEISLLGFGCWALSKHGWKDVNQVEAIKTLERSIELGINFFDTAPIYGFGKSEEILGEITKSIRKDIVIASKFGLRWNQWGHVTHDISRDSILFEVEASLKRLQTDYIDLYQVHHLDGKTSLETVFETLNQLKEEGVIKAVGVSNFKLEDLKKASNLCDLTSIQNQYNMLQTQDEKDILPFCEEKNISYISYSTLAQGLLSEKVKEGYKFSKMDIRKFNDLFHDKDIYKKIESLKTSKKPLIESAFEYVLKENSVKSILVSTTKVKNLEENVKLINKLGKDFSKI